MRNPDDKGRGPIGGILGGYIGYNEGERGGGIGDFIVVFID